MSKDDSEQFAAVILAAGQGKRMRSNRPKVLHGLAGKPLISWVIEAARAAGAERIVAVVGYGREAVEAVLPEGVETAVQEEQRGTGHAVRCAEPVLAGYAGPVAVLSGDVPLLRADSIARLAARRRQADAAAAVLTAIVKGEHAYGRIVRNEAGEVARIVEHRDATPEERRIEEINTGTYVFAPGRLFPALRALKNENVQGEFYLTDTIGLLVREGARVAGVRAENARECLGINRPEELAQAERSVQARERG